MGTVIDIKEKYYNLILDRLNIKQYDDFIKNNSFGFIRKPDNRRKQYQTDNVLNMDFIFLRNEIHTERLTEEEMDILDKGGDDSDKLLQSSFERVISKMEISSDEDREVMTSYDRAIKPEFVKMNALVLVIGTYPEFDENGKMVDLDREIQKKEELRKIAAKMEDEFAGKFGIVPVTVLIDA